MGGAFVSLIQVFTPVTDRVTGPDKRTQNVTGVWDTGASSSVITQKIVDELGISPIRMTLVHSRTRDPGHLRDGRHATPAELAGFGPQERSALALTQLRPEHLNATSRRLEHLGRDGHDSTLLGPGLHD